MSARLHEDGCECWICRGTNPTLSTSVSSDARLDVRPVLTEDERSDVTVGLAFLALHHKEQIKDWQIAPRGDRRNKYRREWEDNHKRIVAHHEARIRELSALCGKLGARDWVAAEEKGKTKLSDQVDEGRGAT